MRIFKNADKKGMPKICFTVNNLVSFDIQGIEDKFDRFEVKLKRHHLENLYGQDNPAYRKHGITKPLSKEKR
jgi:hypothetical protein